MERLKKPFEPITTLVIIYLGLVTVSIALYALIQIYVNDKATASNLLSWTATLFATIALLYTFNSWRDQKGSEVLSKKCQNIILDFDIYINKATSTLILLLSSLASNNKDHHISKLFHEKSETLDVYSKIERELIILSVYKNDFKLVLEELTRLNNEYESILNIIKKNENVFSSDDIANYDGNTDEIINRISEFFKKRDTSQLYIQEHCIKYIFYQIK